jgi:hypothetical protein
MTAYCRIARPLQFPQAPMSKLEIYLQKAAEFEKLAAETGDLELRDSYTTVAQSYRRLVQFVEKQQT